jgi:hypothetical protein
MQVISSVKLAVNKKPGASVGHGIKFALVEGNCSEALNPDLIGHRRVVTRGKLRSPYRDLKLEQKK